MIDQYFTPPEVAKAVVASVSVRRVQLVADFAAGMGDLLSAGQTRWPNARVLACDIDPSCIEVLASKRPKWALSQCNFLDTSSRNRNPALFAALGKCDLALLNPPFSGKGGATSQVSVNGIQLRCSHAMAFVVASVAYLRLGGEIVAILPASCITSAKDADAREYCATNCNFSVEKQIPRGAFPGCAASTVIVKLRNRRPNSSESRRSRRFISSELPEIGASLIRGCIPVYRAENGLAGREFPYVHSTDIHTDGLSPIERGVSIAHRIVRGPAVLISRVGSPMTKKCCCYVSRESVVLSDCVIAIKCGSQRDANEVRNRMLSKWKRLSKLYCGTCAPYITIEVLRGFLRELRVHVT